MIQLEAYPKNTTINMQIEINNERVEEDLFICTRAEITVEEIKKVLEEYEKAGILGLYHYFMEILEPELSYISP
jgi:hypothetical protein